MTVAVAGGTGTIGRHIVDVLRARGHSPVVLSRSHGVNLVTGAGLAEAMRGVDIVIDVTSIPTRAAREASAFFDAVTRNLLRAGAEAGARHHVALGIVGSDRVPVGYYAGKLLQEERLRTGPMPWTLLRATQFHEFAAQPSAKIPFGPLTVVPRMTLQPIAAREVAERLVTLALRDPSGRAPDIAGPRIERLADMVRAWERARGREPHIVELPLPGVLGRALRDGALTSARDATAHLGVQTFADWLTQSGEAAARSMAC